MTNGDLIRMMNDEELWMCVCGYYNGDHARCKNYANCRECWIDWLGEEADGLDESDESKKTRR